jgi:hypothetical protein
LERVICKGERKEEEEEEKEKTLYNLHDVIPYKDTEIKPWKREVNIGTASLKIKIYTYCRHGEFVGSE